MRLDEVQVGQQLTRFVRVRDMDRKDFSGPQRCVVLAIGREVVHVRDEGNGGGTYWVPPEELRLPK